MNKTNLIPCEQNRCAFRNNGCKSCEECKAVPNMINPHCTRCFECEQKEGRLRWGDDDITENKIAQAKEESKNQKIIHNEIMVVAR